MKFKIDNYSPGVLIPWAFSCSQIANQLQTGTQKTMKVMERIKTPNPYNPLNVRGLVEVY